MGGKFGKAILFHILWKHGGNPPLKMAKNGPFPHSPHSPPPLSPYSSLSTIPFTPLITPSSLVTPNISEVLTKSVGF